MAVDELRVAAFPGHLLELFRAYELLVSGMVCRGGCFMYLGVVPGVVYYRWPSSRAAFGFFHCRDVTKSYLQFFYFVFDQGGAGVLSSLFLPLSPHSDAATFWWARAGYPATLPGLPSSGRDYL